MTKRRGIRRTIRWVVMALVAASLWFGILRRFSVKRLEVATVVAMEPVLKRGGLHLIDADPPHILQGGWVLWWRWEGGAVFSRVLALPGEVVTRRGERWCVRGEAERLLRPELRLAATWHERVLGPGEYLLVNDKLDAPWPDSRRVGPVSRADVVAHVLFAF
ncbi:MAG: hypothetical protein CMJ85_09660 [Planctomycetes bacterium]|jgi:hypothetical protein|nr:hypothetical protein [Planctomycetota bacterium]MDP6424501.1 hypothetical protein [Planctomycetota bacterium]